MNFNSNTVGISFGIFASLDSVSLLSMSALSWTLDEASSLELRRSFVPRSCSFVAFVSLRHSSVVPFGSSGTVVKCNWAPPS